jgi:hypothetical protein
MPMSSSLTRTAHGALGRKLLVGTAMTLALGLTTARPAHALTVLLNFVAAPTTDLFNVGTMPESFSGWGFTGMSLNDVRNATLDAVMQDYLAYPSVGTNASSPLADGYQLNISFEWSNGTTGPTNGDTEWYYMAIGDAQPNQGFLGQACLACVRNENGLASAANGSIVGSVLTDTISGLLNLATSNEQRINLLAGTVTHEIGHTLNLRHPPGQLPNPGESAWSVMATGASPSLMPSSERVKDRAFAYSEFSTLIQSVGVTPIPEPQTWLMLALGLAAVSLRASSARRARQAEQLH